MKHVLKIEFDNRRVYGLDILRAVAIVSVVMAHGANLLPQRLWKFHDVFLVDGVFLFFVLSGYLIGGILIKVLEKNGASPSALFQFWVRRWFRTVPNYFLILTVLVILRFVFFGGIHGIPIWHYYLFIQNFKSPHPLFFSEAWTLSIEEWFYLLVPSLLFLVVGVFKLTPKRAIPTIAISIIFASIALRLHRYAIAPVQTVTDWDLIFRKQVVTRLDSLMFGVLGAYCTYYYKSLWLRHKRLLFGVGLSSLALQHLFGVFVLGPHITQRAAGLYLSVFSFTFMATSILLLLPWLGEYRSSKGKVYTAITYISIASYSMYLLHVSLVQPLVVSLVHLESRHLTIVVRYVLYWLLTITASILLYKYFEKPATDLRDKFVSKKHTPDPKPDPSI